MATTYLRKKLKNMSTHYEDYRNIALKPFAEKLQSDYYESIETLCATSKKQCDKMINLEKSASSFQYVTSCEQIISEIEEHIKNRKTIYIPYIHTLVECEKIISEIEEHIKNRKTIYIPYIHTLVEKVNDNHNCSTCTGKCKINHDMHIMDLTATNQAMSRVLHKLQMVMLPLYSDTMYPDEYRVLRLNMTLLETSLAELFFVENNYLIPKIADAQKNINASSN